MLFEPSHCVVILAITCVVAVAILKRLLTKFCYGYDILYIIVAVAKYCE